MKRRKWTVWMLLAAACGAFALGGCSHNGENGEEEIPSVNEQQDTEAAVSAGEEETSEPEEDAAGETAPQVTFAREEKDWFDEESGKWALHLEYDRAEVRGEGFEAAAESVSQWSGQRAEELLSYGEGLYPTASEEAALSESASADYNTEYGYFVSLNLTSYGESQFADATTRLAGNGSISIYMDDEQISTATVENAITDGNAIITGSDFTAESVQDLADKINAGSLPFSLSTDSSKLNIVSPTLGRQSLNVMLIAGLIAYGCILLMMLFLYRLPGFVACLSITCQIAAIFACISGFFPGISSFTLTIPGIAGIILSIGMGVDANVIVSERIREEIRNDKTIDGAIKLGFKRGFTAILDGNVTVLIVSVILMGAFGPPTSIWSKIVSVFMFMFDSSITGSIYSFGYTLLIGAICNLVIGVVLTRLMTKSLSQMNFLRKPWLFGGARNGK